MSELLLALNLLVIIRAAIAWFSAEPADELERADFRSSSWPSDGGDHAPLG